MITGRRHSNQEKSGENQDVAGHRNHDGWDGGDKGAEGREGEHVGHRHCCKNRVRGILGEGRTQKGDPNLCDVEAKESKVLLQEGLYEALGW